MNEEYFRKTLAAKRNTAGYSLQDLSDEIRKRFDVDIPAPTLYRYESGKIKKVPYDVVIILSQIFNMDPKELVGMVKKPQYSETEKNLITDFRSLSQDGQRDVLRYVRMLKTDEEEQSKKDVENSASLKQA